MRAATMRAAIVNIVVSLIALMLMHVYQADQIIGLTDRIEIMEASNESCTD